MARRSSDDDEPSTPRVVAGSGSYALFRDEAILIAEKIEEIVFISQKRIDLHDEARIANGERIAHRLRELSAAFAMWPNAPPEQVAEERLTLAPELVRLLGEALLLLQAMPTVGTLGKVPRIR